MSILLDGYETQQWPLLLSTNKQLFIFVTFNKENKNNFTDLLTQKQTFNGPQNAKRSLLQTQVCKYRHTWELCIDIAIWPSLGLTFLLDS
jgi:hypothetical protein